MDTPLKVGRSPGMLYSSAQTRVGKLGMYKNGFVREPTHTPTKGGGINILNHFMSRGLRGRSPLPKTSPSSLKERGDRGGEVEMTSSIIENYEYLKKLFPPEFIDSLPEGNFLHRLLLEQHPSFDIWRKQINDCLELAYRYNLVNADFKGRITKGDWESWEATMNELKVARFIESTLGIGCLGWHPEGKEERVGEFELTLNNINTPIFIEIKTIFPRDLERLEQKIIDKLRRYAEQVSIPMFLSVIIESVGSTESFSGIKFKDYLKSALPRLVTTELEKGSIKLPDYHDKKTGLYLKIETLAIKPKKEEKNCHIGVIGGGAKFIKNEVHIHHSLYKAYAQLPVEKQPCLVILCSSTAFLINKHIMLNALLGTLALRVYQSIDRTTKVPEPESFRKSDGFFQSRRNRKLSAVGLYKEKLAETGMEVDMDIYHNPFSNKPLNMVLFKDKGVRQLVRKNETEMEWVG